MTLTNTSLKNTSVFILNHHRHHHHHPWKVLATAKNTGGGSREFEHYRVWPVADWDHHLRHFDRISTHNNTSCLCCLSVTMAKNGEKGSVVEFNVLFTPNKNPDTFNLKKDELRPLEEEMTFGNYVWFSASIRPIWWGGSWDHSAYRVLQAYVYLSLSEDVDRLFPLQAGKFVCMLLCRLQSCFVSRVKHMHPPHH